MLPARLMLLAANYALSGRLAWTPGGAGVSFGRMMQDGIVARYLNDHCDTIKLKLCPYRNQLPATADEFLWGRDSIFNKLGRFEGMNDEMEFIATQALAAYPLWQTEAALERRQSNWCMSAPAKAPTAGFRTPTALSSAICRNR